MGHALARRLLDAGQPLQVWNRTPAKAQDLVPRGAEVVDSVGRLATRKLVFSIVSADRDLLEVMLGSDGLLSQRAVPEVILDATTVSGETSRRIRVAAAERGSAFLAMPVSGTVAHVREGSLSIAASGDRAAFEVALPLLGLLGGAVTYVGGADEARLVKLAHNVVLGVVTQSLAEVLVLAEKGGVSRRALLGFLNGSVLGSAFSRSKTPALLGLTLDPTFTVGLLLKDLDLGLGAAQELVAPMPVASTTRDQVRRAIGRGHEADDIAALLVEQGHDAGVALRPEVRDPGQVRAGGG
jgi:3-hydroxyisobutyrate dehydrogenase-like beta-hydroxyacid dehydrogenase